MKTVAEELTDLSKEYHKAWIGLQDEIIKQKKKIMSEKLSITFSTVSELLLKADQIRDFAITQEILRRKQFDNIGIIYEHLNEYGVAIDIGECTEEQLLAIKEILLNDTLREFVAILESSISSVDVYDAEYSKSDELKFDKSRA